MGLNYEQWDLIADSYIPLLVLYSLASLVKTNPSDRKNNLISLTLSVLLVYGMMFLDNWLHIWPVLGWDYSTHTALSLVLVTFLYQLNTKFKAIIIGSFILYLLLMFYQQYHTWADMLSTIAIIMPLTIIGYKVMLKKVSS